MADQKERIVYEIDSRSVKAFKEQANQWLAEAEAKSKSAGESIANTVDKTATHIAGVTQRSASAIQRIVANAEKSARDFGATAAERIESRRIFDLGKVAGDPTAINRVNSAYDELLRKQSQLVDNSKELNRTWTSNLSTIAATVVSLGALRKVIEVSAVDTALYAARTETMGVAMNAAGRANHYARLELAQYERSVKALGITTQGARQGILRMTTAQLDASKASELARLAQDAAVIGNKNSTEAFNQLIYAIQSGQPEMLRTIGINVTFEKEYQRLARSMGIQTEALDEHTKTQARLNAVLRASPNFANIYEESLGTVGKQLTSLRRHFEEAQNAVGKQFLPALGQAVTKLTELAKFIETHPEVGLLITGGAGIAATTIGGAVLGGQIGGPAGGILGAKLGAAAGILGTIAVVMPTIGQHLDNLDELFNEMLPKWLQLSEKWLTGGAVAQAKAFQTQAGMISVKLQRELMAAPGLREFDKNAEALEAKRERNRQAALELAKQQAAAEKQLRNILLDAQKDELEGTEKILARRRELIVEYGISAKALRQIDTITESIARKENTKILKELGKAQKESTAARLKEEIESADARAKIQADFYQQTVRDSDTIFVASKRREIAAEEQAGRARIAEIDAVNRHDLHGLLNIESQRATIQEETIMRVFSLRMKLLDAQAKHEIAQMEVVARLSGIHEDAIAARRTVMLNTRAEEATAAAEEVQSRIDEVRATAQRKHAQLVIDHQQRSFDRLKSSAESVFDALLTRSKSFGEALADAIKLPLLTMLKNILSTQTAMLLMRIFGGGGIAGAGAGNSAGGFLGRLAGFGAFGQMAMGGIGRGGGGMFGMPGAPGGTPGFAGPVSAIGPMGTLIPGGGVGGAGIGLGGGGLAAGALGLPLLGLAGLGGFGAFKLGQRGGILGTAGGAGLGAFSGLTGFGALTSLFPSLVAAGPLGFAAAGGIGAAIGLIGVFRKSAERKVKDKIRDLYGVTIGESNILKQITSIAKDQFGGNLDLAIRAPIVRELVELYKLTMTGTGTGFSAAPRGFSAIQSGGAIYQSPSSPALTQPYTPAMQSTSPVVVTQIHVVGAQEFFTKETVQVISNNSRAVQESSLRAQRSNTGRTQASKLQWAPNQITSS